MEWMEFLVDPNVSLLFDKKGDLGMNYSLGTVTPGLLHSSVFYALSVIMKYSIDNIVTLVLDS